MLDEVISIDLSENLIEEITNIPESVKFINLFSNKIKTIKNIPKNIILLDLSDNLVSKLIGLPKYKQLEALVIYENKIEKIPSSLLKLKNLKSIDYRSNPVKKLNSRLFVKFNNLDSHKF